MRVCTICKHPQRAEIDRALVDNETLTKHSEALRYRRISRLPSQAHLPQHLAKAAVATEQKSATALVSRVQEKEVIEFRSARDLLGRLGELEGETRSILAEARSATTQVPCSKCGATVEIRTGSNDTALRAIARIEGQLRLAGDIIGVLKTKLSVEVRTIRSYNDLSIEEIESLVAEVKQAQATRALNEGGVNGSA